MRPAQKSAVVKFVRKMLVTGDICLVALRTMKLIRLLKIIVSDTKSTTVERTATAIVVYSTAYTVLMFEVSDMLYIVLKLGDSWKKQ